MRSKSISQRLTSVDKLRNPAKSVTVDIANDQGSAHLPILNSFKYATLKSFLYGAPQSPLRLWWQCVRETIEQRVPESNPALFVCKRRADCFHTRHRRAARPFGGTPHSSVNGRVPVRQTFDHRPAPSSRPDTVAVIPLPAVPLPRTSTRREYISSGTVPALVAVFACNRGHSIVRVRCA